MKRIALPCLRVVPLLALTLGGCITFRSVDDGTFRARILETVQVGPLAVRPEAVIEDSRCPAETQCVWAGRVRIRAQVDGSPVELSLGEPRAFPAGRLTLAEVNPPQRKDITLYPDEYRFGFTFSPNR